LQNAASSSVSSIEDTTIVSFVVEYTNIGEHWKINEKSWKKREIAALLCVHFSLVKNVCFIHVNNCFRAPLSVHFHEQLILFHCMNEFQNVCNYTPVFAVLACVHIKEPSWRLRLWPPGPRRLALIPAPDLSPATPLLGNLICS
jgi:hypothetical protein